ncbi:hypothetical protein HanIR_Chr04g0174831 [Helianthus annuus]|nr:hypothetical protein HanIR_Chr04g0174831 [Helianthus annuus]
MKPSYNFQHHKKYKSHHCTTSIFFYQFLAKHLFSLSLSLSSSHLHPKSPCRKTHRKSTIILLQT